MGTGNRSGNKPGQGLFGGNNVATSSHYNQ